MKKLIAAALAVLTLLSLCCGSATAAQSASTPKYSVFVRVYYLDGELYNTCDNSDGYIVMPTRRQDGSPGTTWWARVEAGEWDDRYTHCYTLQSGDKGANIDGFPAQIDGIPTELRLVKDNSATSTNYMTSNNKTYTTHYGFEVCVKTGWSSWEYVTLARFVETTLIGGKWSDEKKLGSDVYPHVYNVKSGTTSGPAEAYIPMNGYGDNTYQFNTRVVDQYGAEWYQDNVNMNYFLGNNLPSSGVSINSSGVLTVSSAAASSGSDGPVFETTVMAEVALPSDDHLVNTVPLTIYYPKLAVRYYDESGNTLLSVQYPYLWTLWTHNVDPPAKEPDANCHYPFRGWEVNDSSHSVESADRPYLITGNTTFTARYSAAAHSMALNGDCTARICSVCGYTESLTLSDLLNGSGTQSAPYRITGTDDWNHLAAYISAGGNVGGMCFRLDSDITAADPLGTADHPFNAVFDGGGHTLTFTAVNQDNNARVAPIAYAAGATIRNLRTVGSITGNYDRVSGLIGENTGSTTVENCRVSMTLSGKEHVGGFCIGNGGTLTFTGCVFDGSIAGSSKCGGFVSWEAGNLTLSNCLFVPTSVSGSGSIGTFCYNSAGTPPATLTNSYYRTAFGTAQGTQAFTVSAGSGVNIDCGTPAAAYSTVTDLTICQTGLMYQGVLYAGEGETVPMSLTADSWEGYTQSFAASAGVLAEESAGWSLTMPGEDTVISVQHTPTFATAPAVCLTMGGSSGGYDNQGPENLFDGLDSTKWCCRFNGQHWVEFHSYGPVVPTACALTTGGDTETYPGRNPVSWRLLGRMSAGDSWTVLTEQSNSDRLPAENCAEVFFPLYPEGGYQYYRLEVTAIKSGSTLQLSEFTLIGTPAFGIPDLTLPSLLTAVEADAFEGIAASIVDVPANCRSIGDRAFRLCPNLTQIRIPADCELGKDVFDRCTLVYIFGTAGSPAETYCDAYENCVFVEEVQN